jgi:Tfp pilus assembly protein PilE
MHYLGNASISNYRCSYETAYVVGAALIAVAASTTALAVFFVFESTWKTAWWRRILCAAVLAGAVSGMHWCAAVGTKYVLKERSSEAGGMSRDTTIIIVIVLAVAACLAMGASTLYSLWVRRSYASKAQQVVLASAFFDKKGRILVNKEGLLPTEVVTDSLILQVRSRHARSAQLTSLTSHSVQRRSFRHEPRSFSLGLPRLPQLGQYFQSHRPHGLPHCISRTEGQ